MLISQNSTTIHEFINELTDLGSFFITSNPHEALTQSPAPLLVTHLLTLAHHIRGGFVVLHLSESRVFDPP